MAGAVLGAHCSSLVFDYRALQKQKAAPGWGNADALCLRAGKSNDGAGYKKSISLHFYLFVDSKSKAGFEFPDTIIVFVEKEMLILTSAKKCTYLEPFKEGSSEELKLTLQDGLRQGRDV